MSLNEHQKWKINHNIDLAITTIFLICLIYLLPVIFFIAKSFFSYNTSKAEFPEIQNWVRFILRTSNDFWIGIINRIFGLVGS